MKKPGSHRAWLLRLQRLPAHVVLSRRSVLPDLIHAPLALFPCGGHGCGSFLAGNAVQLSDGRLLPIPCRSLASQREIRCAIFVAVLSVVTLLATDSLQQNHEQPSLLLG